MTFKVKFAPESDAGLDRLFDGLLVRSETGEEAMRACDAIAVIRSVADSHLSTTPCSYRKVVQRPTCANSSFHPAPLGTSFVSTYALRRWSSSSTRATRAKRITTEVQPRLCIFTEAAAFDAIQPAALHQGRSSSRWRVSPGKNGSASPCSQAAWSAR